MRTLCLLLLWVTSAQASDARERGRSPAIVGEIIEYEPQVIDRGPSAVSNHTKKDEPSGQAAGNSTQKIEEPAPENAPENAEVAK